MKLKTPKSISHSHEYLCSELKSLINNGNRFGEEAKVLSELMVKHFEKEERYALPPLGLLLTLAEGKWQIDEKTIIKMSDELNSKRLELKEEHEQIYNVMQNLVAIAEKEDYRDAKRFIKDLQLHMELEDQVLYPASVLVGNYLKKFKSSD